MNDTYLAPEDSKYCSSNSLHLHEQKQIKNDILDDGQLKKEFEGIGDGYHVSEKLSQSNLEVPTVPVPDNGEMTQVEHVIKALKNENISLSTDFITCKQALCDIDRNATSKNKGDEFCPLTNFIVKSLSSEKLKKPKTKSSPSSTASSSSVSLSTSATSSTLSNDLVNVPLDKTENKVSQKVTKQAAAKKECKESMKKDDEKNCLSRIWDIFGCFNKKS